MKKLLTFFIIVILFSFYPINTYAYDKEVVCGSAECTGFSGALFSELDIKPGDSINKTLSIKNEKNEDIKATLSSEKNLGTDDILSEKITIIIYDGGNILFSGTFNEFLGKEITLGNILKDQTKIYEIQTAFPIDSGNEYQNKRVNFSLILSIKGSDSGTIQVLSSLTDNSSNSENSNNSLIGQVLGLSDTGGIFYNLLYITFGIASILIGTKYIRKGFKNIS